MHNVHIYGMSAAKRRALILDLLRRGPVATQQDLGRRLSDLGMAATQTTLSRDLSALGAVKTNLGYQLPGRASNGGGRTGAFGEPILSTQIGDTMLVIRTPPAHAHPVAQRLDEMEDPDVLGTIAGDDTVFVAMRSVTSARRLSQELAGAVPGERPRTQEA